MKNTHTFSVLTRCKQALLAALLLSLNLFAPSAHANVYWVENVGILQTVKLSTTTLGQGTFDKNGCTRLTSGINDFTYATYTFRSAFTGNIKFGMTYSSELPTDPTKNYDSVILVYKNFDPLKPGQGCLGANDDTPAPVHRQALNDPAAVIKCATSGWCPQVEVEMTGDALYTVVFTVYHSNYNQYVQTPFTFYVIADKEWRAPIGKPSTCYSSKSSDNHLFTTVADNEFSLDVVMLNAVDDAIDMNYSDNGNQNIKVEIVEGSDIVDGDVDSCKNASVVENMRKDVTILKESNGKAKNVLFKLTEAHSNLRCRVTELRADSPGQKCSADAFTARPKSFTLSSAAIATDGTNSTLANPIKAGADFALNANALKGYNGKPTIVADKIKWDISGVTEGMIKGALSPLTFSNAAVLETGKATSNFTYSEVGYFQLLKNAVQDNDFTDLSKDLSSGDCLSTEGSKFNNTADANGLYGCSFGNEEEPYFGRFIPHHFKTTVLPINSAPFVYSGQPFAVKIEAQNAQDGITKNYREKFARAVTLSARDANGEALPAATPVGKLDSSTDSAIKDIAASRFATGTMTTNNTEFARFAFTALNTNPTQIRLNATERKATVNIDGVDVIVESDGVKAVDVDGSAKNKEWPGAVTIQSGRAFIHNKTGFPRADLAVPFLVEFWSNGAWVLSANDIWTGNTSLNYGSYTLNTVATPFSNDVTITGFAQTPNDLGTCVLDHATNKVSGNNACAATAVAGKQFNKGKALANTFAGNFNLWLAAPTSQKRGVVQITATVPWWLDQDGTKDGQISGRAVFGAQSPYIYRREVY